MNAELLDLLRQDVYTDAWEYRERVDRIRELLVKEHPDEPEDGSCTSYEALIKAQQAIQERNPPDSQAWKDASKEIHRLLKAQTGKTYCPDCGYPLDLDHTGCHGVDYDDQRGGWKVL